MDIYVVAKSDLEPGLKCAQVGHAVAGLTYQLGRTEHVNGFTAVYAGRLIVLDGPPINSLLKNAFQHYTFYEPDLNDEPTATAFLVPEGQRYYFSSLQLAYKEPRWKKKLKAIIARW